MRTNWVRTVLIASAAVCAIAGDSAAQIPGMGSIGRGRVPSGLKREPGIDVPPVVNIVNIVVEHRQDLTLTDSQFVHVVAIKRSLDSTNAPLLRRIDSVSRLFKTFPLFTQSTPEHRDSLNAGRAVVKEMTADIDDNIADAKDKVFALLSTPQKEKAEQLEDKARKASASAGRGRS
jgi:hypothetical protein